MYFGSEKYIDTTNLDYALPSTVLEFPWLGHTLGLGVGGGRGGGVKYITDQIAFREWLLMLYGQRTNGAGICVLWTHFLLFFFFFFFFFLLFFFFIRLQLRVYAIYCTNLTDPNFKTGPFTLDINNTYCKGRTSK